MPRPARDHSGWSVRELRSYLAAQHVDASACVEKSGLVELARQALARRSSGSGSGAAGGAGGPPAAGSQPRQPASTDPMEDRTGTSFYRQRLARTAAVPEEQRGSDVAAFLAVDQLLSEMADMLPLVQRPGGGYAADPAVPRDTVTLALLKEMVAADVSHGYVLHPVWSYMRLPYYLKPYMVCAVNPATGEELQGSTISLMLAAQPSCSPIADLHLLARLLSCPEMMSGAPDDLNHERMKLGIIQTGLRSLRDPTNQASLQAQLEALCQRTGCKLSELPTLYQLQGRYSWVVVRACHDIFLFLNEADKVLPADLIELWRSEAAHLARLRPYQPRAHYQLSNLALMEPSESFQGTPALQYLLRGLELARAQKDGYWIARCAAAAARHAAAGGSPAVPPQRARQLLEEAAAAEAACRTVLPEAWVRGLEAASGAVREAKRCVDRHLARGSPQAWVPSIVGAHLGALAPAQPKPGRSVCAGCGKEGIRLRRCSACNSPHDRYCSRECQKNHWPQHKTACKAAEPSKQRGGSKRR